jgi:hypothetical protein
LQATDDGNATKDLDGHPNVDKPNRLAVRHCTAFVVWLAENQAIPETYVQVQAGVTLDREMQAASLFLENQNSIGRGPDDDWKISTEWDGTSIINALFFNYSGLDKEYMTRIAVSWQLAVKN